MIVKLAYLTDFILPLNELITCKDNLWTCLQYEINWMLFEKEILLWKTRLAKENL